RVGSHLYRNHWSEETGQVIRVVLSSALVDTVIEKKHAQIDQIRTSSSPFPCVFLCQCGLGRHRSRHAL
ncbi:hypothetical protein MX031_17475, partial [Ralstonia solanacearum]